MKRTLALAAGLFSLAGAWMLPLHELMPGPFSAHMTMHMAVVAVAAPLLALGVAGGSLDPVRRVPALFPPVPTSIVELIVVWAWHAPALHHAARHETVFLALEQGSFLASALLVWLAAFGGEAEARPGRSAAGIVALLLTSMHMTLLGALLSLPPRALYAHADHGAALSPLDDQHLGGAIMLVAGGIVYLAGGLFLSLELLRHRGAEPAFIGARDAGHAVLSGARDAGQAARSGTHDAGQAARSGARVRANEGST
ncbi:MAG: cytochrome c oxidase assembly protein [Candidatus Binatia bacterium]